MLGQIFIQNYISVVVFPLHLWLSKLQFYIAFLIEVERTSKNRTSNIPNLRGSNFEHIRTSHLGPKPNFEPLEHHQKPNCSRTLLIKNGPNFFQNHQNRTSNMSCCNSAGTHEIQSFSVGCTHILVRVFVNTRTKNYRISRSNSL